MTSYFSTCWKGNFYSSTQELTLYIPLYWHLQRGVRQCVGVTSHIYTITAHEKLQEMVIGLVAHYCDLLLFPTYTFSIRAVSPAISS